MLTMRQHYDKHGNQIQSVAELKPTPEYLQLIGELCAAPCPFNTQGALRPDTKKMHTRISQSHP